MGRYALELVAALLAIVLLTILYAFLSWDGVPSPGGLEGHGLGIIGFLLMLATETLYTLRKRLKALQYGPTGVWLRVHIFTGIVGPYLVILHTAGKIDFNLAGILTLATVIVVLSGFVGRYIYTATPRTLDGVEVGVAELQQLIVETDGKLQALGGQLGEAARAIRDSEPTAQGWVVVLARPYLRWRQRQRVHAILAKLGGKDRAQVEQLETLLDEHYRLFLQAYSLAATRRLLALWHLFHVPLGGVLFTLAVIHVFAALYYSTFMK